MSHQSAADVLGQPLTINTLVLKNRIALSPMAVLQPTSDGRPSAQSVAFLRRRALGGVGLVIVGGSAATERAWNEAPFFPILRLDKEEFLPDLIRMGEAVHSEGAAIFGQLFPSFARMGVPRNGAWPIAASPKGITLGRTGFPDGVYVPGGRVTPPPEQATAPQIKELEHALVLAARRVQAAGWDGVEIAAHMGYFYASFLSPLSNERTDEYGGSVENRARALRDAVAAVRAEVGPDYPVGVRMSANDHVPGGQDERGFAEIAAQLVSAGLDFISLSDGNYESMGVGVPSISGSMLRHGEPQAFRKAVGPDVRLLLPSTPDAEQAAAAITSGHADISMLARQLLADPDYPTKVLTGRSSEIVAPDRDNAVMRQLLTNTPISSRANPELGREDPSARVATVSEKLLVWASGNRPLMTIADIPIRLAKRVKGQPTGPMH
jgi:2,4-dienoyl-CoA reductase-like NADH-dependent reductase (Old Yellow Enzyme family)